VIHEFEVERDKGGSVEGRGWLRSLSIGLPLGCLGCAVFGVFDD
jgi:hypothetical protein